MKNLKMLHLAAMVLLTLNVHAAWDIYKSGLSMSVGGYHDCLLDGVAPNFQNKYFGRFSSGGTLTIDFAEMLTYKNGSSNACGGNLRYRVYRTCDAAPAYSTLALTFCCNYLQSNTCSGGSACGPDLSNVGDQKWVGTPGTTINLISGLTLSGTYIIEVYFEATGSTSNTSGCEETKYSSNGGANYKAYFEFNTNDHFADSNFSSPTWSGDASNFTIANNSTTSGLTGSEANKTFTPKLNVASGSGSQYISTQIATWDLQQEWYFWVGRDGTGGAPSDLDDNNQEAIYLYANESNLESATVDGYRILLGQTGTSYIRLQRIDNGAATTVFTSSTGVPSSLTDFGIAFKVTRTQLGVWTIYTSTLPTNSTNSQATPTPNSCVESLATVNHGSVTENSIVPASNGYFGFLAVHDATAEGRVAAEFDSFRFRALPPDTYVEFSGTLTGQVTENATTANNYAVSLSIVNPSSTAATSVDIALISGDAARIGGGPNPSTPYAASYTTQTVTWSAGQSGTKTIYIDPSNNSLCDDIANLTFRLQNVSGGTNAFIGNSDTLYLDVVDDDKGYETLVDQDFNSGNLNGWKTNGSAWSANSTSPIEGSHSARHSTQAVAGQSSLAYPIDDANLVGVTTTWRFEVAFANDASANNNFQIFLAANDSNFYSSSVDGYAVVIDQSSLPSAGTADYIRLYRVTDGAYASTPIVNSTTDWLDNVNGGTRVGFQVVLGEDGTWNLSVDNNGGFNGLTSLGTGTDATGGAITFPTVKYFGVRFKYLAAASDLFRLDDVSVTQSGCKRIWYSQANGNSTDAIWAATTNGTGQAVVSGRYDRFVVQNGHTVTASGTWLMNDITVSTGATLAAGSAELRVYGNWIRQTGGTFTAGTSTVVFKGQQAQEIGFEIGAATTAFNNLTIDNDGYSVTINPSLVTITGVVSMLEGTLQTNGNLRLISNSTGSASIGEIKSGAAVSGNVELQRYTPSIPNSQGYWFNFACPIQGQTLAEWNDDIITTGFPGSDYPSYGFNNIQYYNESAPGTMSQGYVTATNITNTINNNRGYFIWLGGAAQNFDNTGLIQSGQISIPLSYTVTSPGGIFDYGWNLVGNPYPSEVDWNLVSASLSGPKVYYVYDYQSSTYKYRNASTNTGTASRYIAHSQGFMVKVNTTGQNLVFQESHKTNTGAAFERSEEATNAFVALRFGRGNTTDESMIVFSNEATNAYDLYDVADLQSPVAEAVEMSLQGIDGSSLAQDARPYAADLEIPVWVDMPEAGSYTLSVTEVQNLPLGACLTVEDVITGDVMTLSQGTTLVVETNEAFQGVRLVIRATPAAQTVVTGTSCSGIDDASIDVSVPSSDWNISLSADNGYEFMSQGSVTFDHLAAGEYLLQVEHATCGTSTAIVLVEEPAEIQTVITGTETVECNIGASGMATFEVENAHWFTYELRNSSNAIVRSGSVEGSTAMVEGLPAELYSLHIFTPCSNEVMQLDLRDELANSVDVEQIITPAANNTSEVYLHAISNQPGACTWEFSNGTQLSGNEQLLILNENEVLAYTVNCAGICSASQSGTLHALSLSNNEPALNATARFAQTDEAVRVWFGTVEPKKVEARLLDAQGRVVEVSSFVMNSGAQREWSTQRLSAGVYTLTMSADGKAIFTRKFIK
jgi:hypothetical protein